MSLISFQALASGHEVSVELKGVVCSVCAKRMIERLEKNPAVERAFFDTSRHRLSVELRPGKVLSEKRMGQLIRDFGYPLTNERRVLAADRSAKPK